MVEELAEQGHPGVVGRGQTLVRGDIRDQDVVAVHLDTVLREQQIKVLLGDDHFSLCRSDCRRFSTRCIQVGNLHVGRGHRVNRAGHAGLSLSERGRSSQGSIFCDHRGRDGRVDSSHSRFNTGECGLCGCERCVCVDLSLIGGGETSLCVGDFRYALVNGCVGIDNRLFKRCKLTFCGPQGLHGTLRGGQRRFEGRLGGVHRFQRIHVRDVVLLSQREIGIGLLQRLVRLCEGILRVGIGDTRLIHRLCRRIALRRHGIARALGGNERGIRIQHLLVGSDVVIGPKLNVVLGSAEVRTRLRPFGGCGKELRTRLEA